MDTVSRERVERLLAGRDDTEELTLRQVAAILPYTYPTIFRMRQKGYIRAIRKGSRWMVQICEIRRFNKEGNYNPDSSDSLESQIPKSAEEKAKEPLPIIMNKDGTADLRQLSQEQLDRLGTPIPIDPQTTD